jgi:hypothetical protein
LKTFTAMSFIPNTYPIFEANQVLTNRHLNDLFNYLDSQNRLTRTHLIGIGIVCGWEVVFDPTTLQITINKGCGITSEGYLGQTDKISYIASKNVVMAEPVYEPFKAFALDIQELTTISTDTPLSTNMLKDKALVMFVELRNEGLRNCSPNNCDDKGREVTATVRPLLVPKSIIKGKNILPLVREVRLRRVDVPRTGLSNANDVLEAYAEAIRETEEILSAIKSLQSHSAFEEIFGENKIENNLLNIRIFNSTNASFIQNYYDNLDDLIQAYNELRLIATGLMCTCCPEAGLFPQHLILGEFDSTGMIFSEQNRTILMPSPATAPCESDIAEARVLFERIKVMLQRFDFRPNINLPIFDRFSLIARPTNTPDIRITPFKQGVKLSKKAIPYYYNNPSPTLLRLWNPNKTRKNKQQQNLGYFAPSYATDEFVKTPLEYDLEPYNFLRIEGHLGQNYQEVLQQLLELKSKNRLPIDIIALRAGSFDEKTKIDFSKEKCHFEDLEAVYDAFREELRCSLGKTILKLGSIKIPDGILAVVPAVVAPPAEVATRPITRSFARGFSERITSKVTPQTFFQAFDNDFVPAEKTLGAFMQNRPQIFKENTDTPKKENAFFPTLDIGALIANPVFSDPVLRTSLSFIDQLTTIINLLTNDLPDLDWERFQKEHETLKKLRPTTDADDLKEISEQLTSVITACRLEGLQSIIEEFRRRLKEVKQKQYLNFFLQKHPGIQHKAGVPLGGTFIVVYHEDPEPDSKVGNRFGGLVAVKPNIRFNDFLSEQRRETPNLKPKITFGDKAFTLQDDLLEAISRIPSLINPRDESLLPIFSPKNKLKIEDKKAIAEALQQMPDGTVIADFFLPYMCTSDCAPVQFVLPKTKPTFTFKIDTCPDPQNQGMATVTLKPQGGMPDYEASINGGIYQALSPLQLSGTNSVRIRDAEGIESAEKTITIPAPMSVDLSEFVWEDRTTKQTYTQTVIIKGGIAPFTIKFNEDIILKDQPNTVEVKGLKNGEAYQIIITDANPDTGGCTFVQKDIVRTCKEPCGGLKTRSHYMMPVQIQQRTNKIAVNIIGLEVDGQVLVRDKSQDFAPLIKVQDFLKAELNINRDLWQITDFKIFNDADDKPQLLGMQIEYFDCQQFVLKIELIENERKWRLNYTTKGVRIGEIGGQQSKFEIPTFEIEQADLCAVNPAFESIAVEDFKIGYSKELKSAVSSPEDAVNTWYWQKANGERTNEPKATFEVGNVARVTHLLMGFSKRGAVKIETIVV